MSWSLKGECGGTDSLWYSTSNALSPTSYSTLCWVTSLTQAELDSTLLRQVYATKFFVLLFVYQQPQLLLWHLQVWCWHKSAWHSHKSNLDGQWVTPWGHTWPMEAGIQWVNTSFHPLGRQLWRHKWRGKIVHSKTCK